MIVGKIYFLLVRIKIRYMELAIVRREVTGAGCSVFLSVVSWICRVFLFISIVTDVLFIRSYSCVDGFTLHFSFASFFNRHW